MARMRRPLIGVLLAVALALAAAAGASAQELKLEVTSVTTVATPHDTAPKGRANKGDRIVFRDLLLNRKPQFGKQTGKPVAYDVGTMTYTSASDTTIDVVATFPGIGTIHFAGPFRTARDGTTAIPVVDGTGAFKGVTGTVTIGKGATRAPNIFQIRVPRKLDVTATGVA
jgi:hypothetical protein